jgi:DNA-binding CsgD family transcriptional regulator/tetratricopeptide (TPR) repeat protein
MSEGRRWLERALSGFADRNATRVKALNVAAILASLQDDNKTARILVEESLELGRELGDTKQTGYALYTLARLARVEGHYARAVTFLEESLSLFRELGQKDDIALVLSDFGLSVLHLGEYERATALCEESLALSREMGDLRGIASWLANLATVTIARGDTGRATELCEESLAIRKGLGYKGGIAHTLAIMGRIALYQGAYERATACYQESLTLRQETGEKEGIATALEGLAAVTGMQGQPLSGARLYAFSESLRNLLRAPLTPIDRAYHLQSVATIRAQLDESTFLKAWTAGQAMTLEEAIAEAVQVQAREHIPPTPGAALAASPLTVPPQAKSFGLTAREIEVLRLVTRGLTTTQIAQQLIMSPRTADAHLRSIYSKLEVTSRAAATRSALEHQLV